MERLAKQGAEAEQAKGIPMQRWGRVREIADATVFLLAETAGFVTGAEIVVDGGQWRMAGRGPQVVPYPEFLLGNGEVTGVKTGRRAKL